ncbi:polysaccharide biosynthesis tyrosine autokinase [Klebsiella pneumoniae]|uniref:polysaccharide biosynthesis tyrosine autokinase n=1 Tax=Klebsiella pneumoniae TaxID=573 RepID=UPI001CA42CF1|nr:polysaccharide biosynthesis tyrosine autokinase [Klebsiella pneumoniae]MBY8452291.1 polysaccharide biosynthesis tyrosine autokinase [Klebsiella pneumoniae]HBU7161057.1 polysaccharide biosynthesis tyrosine autokinase [Klebsiella pneumoniae]HBW5149191.1 polysaccharide biosynthesis tyrosine autokinase [Klebsiella pneumoniae]HBX6964510.1 polysaccharide biosynthesis tyrosine autokinase [Klebsiella pneumoniae]HBX7073443.1 polysaccharide biosynthesis tyrosine autokinase [Klebsiella pneumoniae]
MSSATSKNILKDDDEMDLGKLIGELIDHRKLIIAITSFCTLISLVYAIFATPIYQANSLIQVEQKQGNAILSNLSQMLPDSQPQSAPEISLIKSRMILGKTVDDLNLQTMIKQNYFPIFGQGLARLLGEKPSNIEVTRLYVANANDDVTQLELKIKDGEHYQIKYDGAIFNGRVGELLENKQLAIKVNDISAKPGDTFTIYYFNRLKAIADLLGNLNVSDQGKDTGILSISYTGENPQLIKNIVNSISENYLAQNISRQAAQDAKSLDFLNIQLPKVRNDLDIAENKLNAYRRQSDSVDLSLEAKAVLDQIVNVDNQLNELTFRESEISQLYTKEHPTYKALMEKRKTLQEEKLRLNKKVSSMPETQQEILRLSRDVESGRAVYMQLLNRQQELNIAKSSAIGNVRIIDDAVTQLKPVKPKKILVVIIGFILGLSIAIGVVFLRVMLRRGIETPEQLEEIGINVYASVPVAESLVSNDRSIKNIRKKITHKEYTGLLAITNPADLAIEAIRGLRTSLHFAMIEARNNILMISGASPNAGKTFISSNLAAVVAQTGKKVLFIDTDMRKGYVHKVFDVENDNGLSSYLSGKLGLEAILKRIPEAGFDFISRGVVPPNPTELLMHRRMEEMLKWASQNYDLVILDTPPILAVTDAAIIGHYAGTTLLVARFELNTVKEMDVAFKRFEQSGIVAKGCILNGIVKKASSYYGYGYNHYGYSYKDNT